MLKHPTNHDDVLLGFAPIINATTHTLILGSFPGAASLRAQQYYAFPQNQFWRLLSGILDIDLVPMDYPERLAHLLAHGIGLWDVFAACIRPGSLDSAIQQGQLNDFSSLQKTYPHLRHLYFNGKTAGKIEHHLTALGYQTRQLPSSSPAYAQMRFADKLKHWQQIAHKSA